MQRGALSGTSALELDLAQAQRLESRRDEALDLRVG
jgi:hypothetical protein